MYPELLAQAIYAAFLACFPNSGELTDVVFQSELCDIVVHILTGVHRSAFPAMPGTSSESTQRQIQARQAPVRTRLVRFNVHGNSPMVQHYIDKHGLRQQPKCQIARHELIRSNPRAINYQKIVKDSSQQAQARMKTYKLNQEILHQQRLQISVDMAAKLAIEDQTATQLLSRASDVKIFTDKLVEQLI